MAKNRRPTLQDIADRVGVTKMTVSRCLKDPSTVSAATHKKVMAAVEQLGYIPNRAPAILSSAKSKAIGVLVPSLANHLFAEVVQGIESVTEDAGFQVMLAHYGAGEEVEEKRIASLLSYNVDGLLLSESIHTDQTRRMIEIAGIPVIEMMDSVSQPIQQAVGFNNIAAARDMVRAMLNKGYRKIVYLGARRDMRTELRFQGYSEVMQQHGLEPLAIMTEEPSSFSLGSSLLHRVLDKYPDTDALFCTNDDLAAGVVFECHRQGLSVPGQLAVAGFHGHDVGQSMSPQLASVCTPRFEVGQRAASELLARIDGAPIGQTSIDLGYRLSFGGSM